MSLRPLPGRYPPRLRRAGPACWLWLVTACGCSFDVPLEHCGNLDTCPNAVTANANWPSSITPGTELEVRVCEDAACTPWSAVDLGGPSVSLAPWTFQIGVVTVTEDPASKLCAGFPPGYDQPALCLSAVAKAGYAFADQARLKWSLRARSADAPFLEFEKVVNAVFGDKPLCSDSTETCRYSEPLYFVDPALTR